MSAGPAADGYLTAASNYDGTMYVLGKSQSKTTVSAPQTAIAQGGSVVITGTVLDQAPASTGTPSVSDESMATWMDYLHFQMPIDGIYHNITITGVPVSIDAVDPNGNPIHIGDTVKRHERHIQLSLGPRKCWQIHCHCNFHGQQSLWLILR